MQQGDVAPPTGSKIEPSGYATILRAPPAPYYPPPRIVPCWERPLPPGDVRRPSDDEEIISYRCERGISLAQARAEIMQLRIDGPEARLVEARAKTAEPNNFVALGIQRSPVIAWKFAFKRHADESLRRYTSNARFVAVAGGYTAREADALWQAWWPKFEPYSNGGGRGADGLVILIKMTEGEFHAIPQFRDFVPPSGVKLDFPKEPDLPRITADSAPFVRIFPQQHYFPGVIPTAEEIRGGDTRITLRDGCLFLGDSLLRVGRTMGLFRDGESYLALRIRGDPSQPSVRIGEQITGGGGYSETLSDADRTSMISQCGDHPIVDLYSPKSKVNWEKYMRSQYPQARR